MGRRHSNGYLQLVFAGCCGVLPDDSNRWILESAGTQIAIKDLESSPFFPGLYRASTAPNWQAGQAVTVRIFVDETTPSAVRNLTARGGNQQVHVEWDRPETIGDPGTYLFYYEYQRKDGSGPWSEWIESPAQTQQTTGFTLKGLDNGTVYSFRVRMINTKRFTGPDGETVSATPQATYRLSLTHWGIRRGGKGTPVTLSVGGGPFRGTQTYTLHWNGNPVNQAPLHADNPTTMVLPAGQTQVTVELKAAADEDGAGKVYNAEVQHPLVAKRSGTEVVRTKKSGLYDGNLSVHDNEGKPAASLTASHTTVNEGDAITLTVTLGHRIDRAVTMPLKVTNPNKRPVTVPATITVPANQLSASVTVTTVDTADKDGDHTLTFFIDRDRDDPFVFGSNNVAVTVRDVTPAGTPTIKAITNSVDESGDTTRNAKLNFGVILSKPVNTTVTVAYRTADGSATAGTDYVAKSGTLTFAPNEVRKDVTVDVLNDGVGEPRETFRLWLDNATGGAVLTQFYWALGIIYDKNPTFVVYDAAARESGDGTDTTMSFKVHLLNAADTATVKVDYATADGSARAGSDYTATSGRLTFRPGASSSQIVTVPVLDDAVEDSGETFSLRLSNPQGGAQLHVSDSTATGTILNTEDAVLSASFPDSAFTSSSHSGADDRPQVVVAFSEAVASFAADTPSVSVTGATVSSVQAHTEDGLDNAHMFFLTPGGDGDVTFALATAAACASGGICTAGGTVLTQAPAALTIPGPEDADEDDEDDPDDGDEDDGNAAALSASFADVPASHDGSTWFTFTLTFSEAPAVGYQVLRDEAFSVSDGSVKTARRVAPPSNLAWDIAVEPSGVGDVAIELLATSDCSASGAICTAGDDPRPLSNSPSATVAGPAEDPAVTNTAATGAPTISGTAQVGETLTASVSGISDAEGPVASLGILAPGTRPASRSCRLNGSCCNNAAASWCSPVRMGTSSPTGRSTRSSRTTGVRPC